MRSWIVTAALGFAALGLTTLSPSPAHAQQIIVNPTPGVVVTPAYPPVYVGPRVVVYPRYRPRYYVRPPRLGALPLGHASLWHTALWHGLLTVPQREMAMFIDMVMYGGHSVPARMDRVDQVHGSQSQVMSGTSVTMPIHLVQ